MKQLICLAVLSFPLFAQSTKVTPDCTLGASFTTTGSSSDYDNRSGNSANSGPPCTLWALTWSAQSAVTSLTINIEGAPDSNGTPGSFASLTSAATFPSGKVTYDMTGAGSYSPWMRITVSAVGAGGAINAVLNGWREDPASIGGGGGGGSGCAGTTGTPCVIGGNANGTAKAISYGLSQAGVALSAATDVVLVSGTSGKTTYLTRLGLAWDNAATVTIKQGTTSSTPCDTSTATIDGPYGNATLTGLFQDYASDFSPLQTSATGLDICAHFSTSVSGGGGVAYSQF